MAQVINEIFPRFVEKLVNLGISANGVLQATAVSEEHRELSELQKNFYLFIGAIASNNLAGILQSKGTLKKIFFFF